MIHTVRFDTPCGATAFAHCGSADDRDCELGEHWIDGRFQVNRCNRCFPSDDECFKALQKGMYKASLPYMAEAHALRQRVRRREENLLARQVRKFSDANRKALRAELMDAQDGKCAYCKCDLTTPNARPQLDHVQPLAKGGTDSRENLALACGPCNNSKHTKTPKEWRRSLLRKMRKPCGEGCSVSRTSLARVNQILAVGNFRCPQCKCDVEAPAEWSLDAKGLPTIRGDCPDCGRGLFYHAAKEPCLCWSHKDEREAAIKRGDPKLVVVHLWAQRMAVIHRRDDGRWPRLEYERRTLCGIDTTKQGYANSEMHDRLGGEYERLCKRCMKSETSAK